VIERVQPLRHSRLARLAEDAVELQHRCRVRRCKTTPCIKK
jgi:hypothetical protein